MIWYLADSFHCLAERLDRVCSRLLHLWVVFSQTDQVKHYEGYESFFLVPDEDDDDGDERLDFSYYTDEYDWETEKTES